MTCKDTCKSAVFSLIVLFVLFFAFSTFCDAQYTPLLFGGYPSYLYGQNPGSYGIFGMYVDMEGIMIPYSLFNGLGSIYSGLMSPGIMSGPGLVKPYLGISGLAPLYGNLGGLEMMGGLGVLGEFGSVGLDNLVGLGSLAGLVSLGSRAGLISNGATGIITSLDF